VSDRVRRHAAQVQVVAVALVVAWVVCAPQSFLAVSPVCLWKSVFHVHYCPGCGLTRAMIAAIHGQWRMAWTLNPLVVVVGPLLVFIYIQTTINAFFGRDWRNFFVARNHGLMRRHSALS